VASFSGSRPRWLCVVVSTYAALFILYALTWAFTQDEGYHVLAAQLIAAGRTPYIDFCFPQTPLNAYWNAGLLTLLGNYWRVPHLFAALFTVGAVILVAVYVFRRIPGGEWRTGLAIAAALMVGLNGPIFVFGSLQAYGICLFGLTAAFTLAVRTVERQGWLTPLGVGFAAGIAAASSLLSAAAAPVFLLWMLYYNRAGARWRTFFAFSLGIAIPFAPVFWLFARGPRQTWFNLVRYHAFYRPLYWPETTQHDLEVLTSWMGDGQALLLGLLAAAGLRYVVRQSGWPSALKAECYLCAWLAAAISLEVGRAHPTFSRYFLLAVPFLAILAVAGLFATARAFEMRRPLWPVLALSALFALGLGRTLYDRREFETWHTYELLAAKINPLSPHNAPLYAVEQIYFLTRRTPPPGYELSYTHLVKLPPKEAALMHIVNQADVKRQFQSGMFATAYTCDDDEIDGLDVGTLYNKKVEMSDCKIFWDLKR